MLAETDFLKNGIKRLFSGTILVAIATIINGAFSYLLQLFLGRLLSVQDYGTYNALLSLFYIFSIPATVLGFSIVKISSELFGEGKIGKLTKLFWGLSKRVFIGGLGVVILLFLLRAPLANYLNIRSPILFLFLGLYVLGNFIVLMPQSYLRGMLLFNKFAVFAVVVGFFRLIIPLGIVYAGYKVGGAYLGLFLSLMVSYLYGSLILKKHFKQGEDSNLEQSYKKIVKFSVPVLFVNIGLILLSNVDVILVKRFFTATEAGYYAGVVTLGKIILFGAGAVSMVMFPEISAMKSAGKNYMKRFRFFLLFQLGVLLPAILVFTMFPRFITLIFFGEQFINSVKYLPAFSVFISIYVLASFMIRFFLAIEKTSVYLLLIIPTLLQFVLINLFHNNMQQVIKINIFSAFVLLVSLAIYLYKINNDSINNRTRVQSG